MNNPLRPQQQTPGPTSSPEKSWKKMLLLGIAVLLALGLAWHQLSGPVVPKTVPLSQIVAQADRGQVKSLLLHDDVRQVVATLKNGTHEQAGYPIGYGKDMVEKLRSKTTVTADVTPQRPLLISLLLSIFPIMILVGAMILILRTTGVGGGKFSKITNRSAIGDIPPTRFTDVAGLDEVVGEMQELVDFLHHPERYERAGAKIPHGFLLVGPPGTGKTLLARAIAGEAGVPFYAISGSDFVETYVGVGASRVRKIFEDARKHGRAIIFIDELDAVGRSRTAGPQNGANEESDRTLNALLVEMDGFAESQIIVLGATNRPEVLDAALLRPGRFDRRVTVGAPDRAGRRRILDLVTAGMTLDDGIDLDAIAKRSSTMTGADLAYLANEAALQSAREGTVVVTNEHFEHAIEVTVLGRARTSMIVSEDERAITAWHEAGHAVVAYTLDGADNPARVSIIPRGGAGGVTWMETDDRHFVSRSRAEAQLAVLMAGRAGEMVLVGDDYTSGAASDLSQAGKLAKTMVTDWAMGPSGMHFTEENHLDRDLGLAGEVDQLLQKALDQATEVLAANASFHRAVAEGLLAEDTIDGSYVRMLAEQVGVPTDASD